LTNRFLKTDWADVSSFAGNLLQEHGLKLDEVNRLLGSIRKCSQCYRPFLKAKNDDVYCSIQCQAKRYSYQGLTKKICPNCKVEFMPKRQRQIYCNPDCSRIHARRSLAERECPQCHKLFKPLHAGRKHCSQQCANDSRRKPLINAICVVCKRAFTGRPSNFKRYAGHGPHKGEYCSIQCASILKSSICLDDAQREKYIQMVTSTKMTRYRKLRLATLLKIDINLKCINCGCDVFEALEINHKGGGGNKEYKFMNKEGISQVKFMYDISRGRRKIDDLEIRCRPCNALHHCETNKGIKGWKIIWEPT